MKKIDRLLSMMAVMVLGMSPSVSFSQVDTLPINAREILNKDNINMDEVEEEKLVIAASRSSKSVDELPVTLYIITHEDIITNGWITLCDVLKTVPGIRVSQPHSGEFGEAFIQRGMMGNTYTKILINGVDIKPAVLTGMVLGANIPVRQAERIEIIYGPASASYGNDACGGVINIVTREADDNPFAEADIMAGTGEYHYVNFVAGGKFGRGKHVAQFSIYGSNLRYKNMNITDYDKDDIYNRWNFYEQRGDRFVYKDAEGVTHDIAPKEITQEVLSNPRYLFQLSQFKEIVGYNAKWNGDLSYPEFCKIGQEAAQAGIEVKYRGLTITYNYLFRKDFSNLGHTPMLFGYSDPSNMMGERIIRAAAIGNWKFGRLTTNTVIKYIFYRMDQNSQRDVCYSNLRQYMYGAGDDIGIEENVTFQAGEKLNLSWGMSYQYSGLLPTTNESPNKFDFHSYRSFATKVDYTDPFYGDFGIYPHTYSTFGTYGQVVWDWKRFSLTGGVRYDYNTKWGASVNPRIACLMKLTDRLTFRVSRGYAFKAPSAQQLNGVTAVNSGITYNNIMRMAGGKVVEDTVLIAYQQMPVRSLKPENIASTEFGLRYYLNRENYMDLVVYTNRIEDPIVRVWAELDTSVYHGIGSSAVPDDYPPTSRAYRNETNSQIQLCAYQFIAVMKDVVKPIHLNLEGGITVTTGHEDISDDSYKGATVNRVNYIRQTPKFMGQLSFDFKFCKIMHLRFENVYCSKWARKYYIGNDNDMFWSTPYYNLDILLGLKFSHNLTGTLKVYNVFDAQYGGIDVKDMDVDLRYNPQLRRNIRICLSYNF